MTHAPGAPTIPASQAEPGVTYANQRGNAALVLVSKNGDGTVTMQDTKTKRAQVVPSDYLLYPSATASRVDSLVGLNREDLTPTILDGLSFDELDRLEDLDPRSWVAAAIAASRDRRDPFADQDDAPGAPAPTPAPRPAPAPVPVPAPAPAPANDWSALAADFVVVTFRDGTPIQVDDVVTVTQDAAGTPYVVTVKRSDGQPVTRKYDSRSGWMVDDAGATSQARRFVSRSDAPALATPDEAGDVVPPAAAPAPVPAPAPAASPDVVHATQRALFTDATTERVALFLATRRDRWPRGYPELIAGLVEKVPDFRAATAPIKEPASWPLAKDASALGVDVGDVLQDAHDSEVARGPKDVRPSFLDLLRRAHAAARKTYAGKPWDASGGVAGPKATTTPADALVAPSHGSARGAGAVDLDKLPPLEQIGRVSTLRALELIADLHANPGDLTVGQVRAARDALAADTDRRVVDGLGRLFDAIARKNASPAKTEAPVAARPQSGKEASAEAIEASVLANFPEVSAVAVDDEGDRFVVRVLSQPGADVDGDDLVDRIDRHLDGTFGEVAIALYDGAGVAPDEDVVPADRHLVDTGDGFAARMERDRVVPPSSDGEDAIRRAVEDQVAGRAAAGHFRPEAAPVTDADAIEDAFAALGRAAGSGALARAGVKITIQIG